MLRTATAGVWRALTGENGGLCCAARSTGRESVPCIAVPATGMQAHGTCHSHLAFEGIAMLVSQGLASRAAHPLIDELIKGGSEQSVPLSRRRFCIELQEGQFCGVPKRVAQCELKFNVCLQRGRDAQGGNDAILLCCPRRNGIERFLWISVSSATDEFFSVVQDLGLTERYWKWQAGFHPGNRRTLRFSAPPVPHWISSVAFAHAGEDALKLRFAGLAGSQQHRDFRSCGAESCRTATRCSHQRMTADSSEGRYHGLWES